MCRLHRPEQEKETARRYITIPDRNITQWKHENLRNGNQKCSYACCTYTIPSEIFWHASIARVCSFMHDDDSELLPIANSVSLTFLVKKN